jgi:hypothetical protein
MPSSCNGSLMLPLVLWNNKPPQLEITTLIVSESENYIFTGTVSGHIVQWEFNNTNNVIIEHHFYLKNCSIFFSIINFHS